MIIFPFFLPKLAEGLFFGGGRQIRKKLNGLPKFIIEPLGGFPAAHKTRGLLSRLGGEFSQSRRP